MMIDDDDDEREPYEDDEYDSRDIEELFNKLEEDYDDEQIVADENSKGDDDDDDEIKMIRALEDAMDAGEAREEALIMETINLKRDLASMNKKWAATATAATSDQVASETVTEIANEEGGKKLDDTSDQATEDKTTVQNANATVDKVTAKSAHINGSNETHNSGLEETVVPESKEAEQGESEATTPAADASSSWFQRTN